MMEKYRDKKTVIRVSWFVCCFLLAAFLRLYKLSDIPYGMHVDEAGMGYDAWLLQKYHMDRWQNTFPVYLINYGTGQSALYAYLCAICIRLFGGGNLDIIWMRIPGVVINLAAYLAGVLIIGKLFQEKWKMFSAALLAVLPYFIMQCRFGMDCNLLVNMLTISLCILFFALEYKKTWIFLLAGVFYGVTYYSYALSYIPNTLILLFMTIYLLCKDRQLWKKMICVWVPAALIAFPLVLMILINQFDLPQISIGAVTITKFEGYRGSEFVFEWRTVLANIRRVVTCILTHDWLPYNAFNGYDTMYGISIPFIVIGFFDCARCTLGNIRKRDTPIDYSVILWAVFACYFVFGWFLGGNFANINKMNGIFFAQFFLLMWGIRRVYDWIVARREKLAKLCMGLLCAVYILNFVSFAWYYFAKYATDINPQVFFAKTYEGAMDYLRENGLDDKETYTPDVSYIYYCLSRIDEPDIAIGHYSDYRNYHFYFPALVEPSQVFIVRKVDENYSSMLTNSGMKLQYDDGVYQVYYMDTLK